MTFEYRVETYYMDDTSTLEDVLYADGTNSWELIQIMRYEVEESTGKAKGIFVFKR